MSHLGTFDQRINMIKRLCDSKDLPISARFHEITVHQHDHESVDQCLVILSAKKSTIYSISHIQNDPLQAAKLILCPVRLLG